MSSTVQRTDSRVIGELEVMDAPLDIAAISAEMPSLDLQKLRSRATIGRANASDVAGNIISNGIINRDAIDAVLAKSLEMLAKAKTVKEISDISEAVKNLINTGVASDAMMLKAAEILSYGSKKKNRQSNAPQAIISGENVQVNLAPLPVAG